MELVRERRTAEQDLAEATADLEIEQIEKTSEAQQEAHEAEMERLEKEKSEREKLLQKEQQAIEATIQARCIKFRRALAIQRWPVDTDGANKWDRTKQGLERTFFRSK